MKANASLFSLPLVASFFASFFLMSCQKDLRFERTEQENHKLVLNFKAVVDTAQLEFGKTYSNSFDEPFTVSTFKFYLHGIEMMNTGSGKIFQVSKSNYYLIDFADPSTTSLQISIPPFQYNAVGFVIGVDSVRNVSGAQSGALDPAKGMFWTWSTGYIMAKLEGHSAVAATPGNAFEYHIGGFKGNENVVRKLTLAFPFVHDVELKPGKNSEMMISANVNAWFHNPHDIRLNSTPVCTTPGTLAKQIAENYSKMFTVVTILND